MEQDELLVILHGDFPVAVDAAGTPGDVPRYEKVRRQVDAVADAGVQEVVELCHLLGADRRAVLPVAEFALIVVDSQCVVAEARKTRRKLLGVGRAHVVRGEAEVDAIEALLYAGLPGELEMVALANDASVLPGGRIDPSCGGKVERRAGLDGRRVIDRHPVVACPHGVFAVADKGRDAAHCHRKSPPFAGLELAGADYHPQRETRGIPLAVVLHHAPCRPVELYAKGHTSRSGDLQRVACCVAQVRNAVFLRQLHRLAAKDDLSRRGVGGILLARKRPCEAEFLPLKVLGSGKLPSEVRHGFAGRGIAAKDIRHLPPHNRRRVFADDLKSTCPRSVRVAIFVAPSAEGATAPPASVEQRGFKMASGIGRKGKPAAIRNGEIPSCCPAQAGRACNE